MLIMPPLQHPLIIIAIPSTQAATATSTSSYPARRHCWRRQHLAVPPPGLAHGIPEACPSLLRPAGHILAKLRTDGTAWCNHRPGFQTESQIIYTLSNELRGASSSYPRDCDCGIGTGSPQYLPPGTFAHAKAHMRLRCSKSSACERVEPSAVS
ncbi:hypothetical protein M433DRAFT_9028 [Acidomyces richmondensis BFW]|nr:hypothetical protein M433DRAFT_9028 [Acidomyces richmondensis BFW]